jgi:hypothetical protein
MNRIDDALELLTAQHGEIDALLTELAAPGAPSAHNETITRLVTRLTIHLALEQELFYPAVSSALSAEVYDELIAEHAEIKRILADLLWLESEDIQFGRKLTALQSLLAWHSTWQERELFERTAETMTAHQLSDLGCLFNAWIDDTAPDLAAAA